ncbi:MAG: protein translocase subunit SecD [Verrucomicrobiaceae bacterium]|nr:protein translocase subunit SecD [Verrucomicrobiaceae bacterium]
MNAYATFLVGAAILLMLLVYVGTAVQTTKRRIGTVLILLATLSSLITVKQMGIALGIDLQGGSEFIVELQPGKSDDGTVKPVGEASVQQAMGILEKRLNPDGQRDMTMQPQGDTRIVIQMPGVKPEEIANVRKLIQQVAHLEFRMVHPESGYEQKKSEVEAAKASGVNDPTFELLPQKPRKDKAGVEIPQDSLVVKRRTEFEGKHVDRAGAIYDAEGWKVLLKMNSEGADLFDATAQVSQGQRMAIIVDGVVISAPVLREKHYGGNAEISGDFDQEEAVTLASLLNNPLENPMAIQSESTVSAAYGQSSINQGKWVGVAALILTALFMTFIYRLAGIVAIIGLVVNMCLLFGALSLFQFTLTMPGIAGLVLTIGMAVDANVLIYERLREEMEAGKTLAGALEAAYDKAFSAIFDSNITTLISAIILFVISGGLVKGFAVTLMIGLISSMIGALIVTRVIFMWVVDKNLITSIKTTRIIPDKVFDILSMAPKFIIASLVVTVISFATLAYKGKSSLGIDFRGGARVDVVLAPGKDVADKEFESLIATLKQPDGKPVGTAYVQRKADPATGATNISIRCEQASGPVIDEAIKAKWTKDGTVAGTSIATVGSVIGSEAMQSSLWALGIALVAIFVYLMFRFEFAFALASIVALFHDVLMVPGLVVLFGQELSIIHVGALLTIAGYSINDTIVVFDRIRETIQRGTGGSTRDMMNEAICKTLSRTLLTGPTALAPMIALLFLGNPAMLEFAMPITIGILLGTYSSIFIASPLVLWYAKKTGTSLKRQVLDAQVEQMRAQQAIAAAQAAGAKV